MCCFSRKVDSVTNTNIFARASKDGRQFLVYSMQFKAGEDLSMILPIPVPAESKEDAVSFINLEKYPKFFDELKLGFPEEPSRGGLKDKDTFSLPPKKLVVVEVGSFVASFVPSIKDFDRLDEQFRLPAGVWDKLPAYKNFGFAVFKLKKGEQKVHPMAFEFPRANRRQLFFPTVHIHDGTVPAQAGFDHALYCQTDGEDSSMWVESAQPAEMFMPNLEEAKGIIDPKGHAYRKIMKGRFDNKDVVI